MAQQHAGPIDLTVSHLSMPEISGRDLAKRLVLQHPKMKALVRVRIFGRDDCESPGQ